MPSLENVQSRMRDALLSKEHAPLDDILGPTSPRFEIHRRHFIHSVTAALEKTFPAVVNLVDARFFAWTRPVGDLIARTTRRRRRVFRVVDREVGRLVVFLGGWNPKAGVDSPGSSAASSAIHGSGRIGFGTARA